MVGVVYNNYLTAYGNKEINKAEVHKKSELRNIYNTIVNVNKHSPLYRINKSENLQRYVIDLKENAISLSRAARAFEDISIENPTFNKKASSSNENVVTAHYIADSGNDVEDIKIVVNKLATPQINEGNYLHEKEAVLSPGKYSFDIKSEGSYYEFHTNVKAQDRPRDLQDRIARLVTNAKIGLVADVKESIDGSSAIRIQSTQTGIRDFNGQPFSVMENDSDSQKGLVEYLGLAKTETEASNSKFTINGADKSSYSNNINVGGIYEIALLNTSDDGEEIEVSARDDYDSFMKDINSLAENYNQVLELSKHRSESSSKDVYLYDELRKIGRNHKNDLEAIGLTVRDDGSFKVEESLFASAIREGTLSETMKAIHSFKEDIISKANGISLNPMQYVNKTMISYPHPIRPIANPYISSIYSGMMYNNYV